MKDYLEIVNHDAFRYGGGLNKSAAEIYWLLSNEELSAQELIQKTGRGKTTIYRALERMSNLNDRRSGECFAMVTLNEALWSANQNIDLNKIALIVGTAGTGKRKREQYLREQKEHKRNIRELLSRRIRQTS